MKPTRVRPRRSTRQSVLDAAAVVLAESPGASMGAVATAAGIGRATLYRHFLSREALIKELSLEAIRACDAACEPVFRKPKEARRALREMLAALVSVGDRFHFLTAESGSTTDPEVVAETDRQAAEMVAFVEHAKEEGLFDAGLPTRWIADTISSVVWTAWAAVADGSLTPAAAADLAFRTVISGLANDD